MLHISNAFRPPMLDRWLAYVYAPILLYLKKMQILGIGARGTCPRTSAWKMAARLDGYRGGKREDLSGHQIETRPVLWALNGVIPDHAFRE